ncbi:hypothetical protein IQ276_038650 [Desmonostoc muscorum LEGE 12446]|uniref:ATPase involved in DNA repair n=1 Tax=Desmonostoc muscorum LEGE 12446 TaxID=1828758 RepID=A0A8J7A791_DESMC|nr:hypothetical protein [Desmonostoc muscorum]MCF2152208.1 hypothetical protein [Desmonostoc muscorum LEGE 12446]
MLALEPQQPSTPDYSVLNSSIKETLTAIDRFEFQAIEEIAKMRNEQLYEYGGYKTFTEYCAGELSAWGGYRRVNQLLGATKVIEALGELGEHIKNERQARPLLRLVEEPDKLKQAVALALEENPDPSQSDFARAANNVVPKSPRKKTVQKEPMVPKTSEPMVTKKASVTVVESSHPRYGQQGTIDKPPPNGWQHLVTFDDGEELINNDDLDAPSVPFPTQRTLPPEYVEAIAARDAQHKEEMQRLEQELRIALVNEARELAQQQLAHELQSIRELYRKEKQEKIQLQQRVDELEGLRQLSSVSQQQQQRIEELERADKSRPAQEWGNTMTKQATKVLNREVKRALEQTIDLRSLAVEPPKDNASECLRLLGLALGNLATAMNNTQALEAAAILMGSEPTPEALAHRAEQLQFVPQAVSEIRGVLGKPGCTWSDFWSVAQQYEVIRQDYWTELTSEEKQLIAALEATTEIHIDEPTTQEAQSLITATEEPDTEPLKIGVGSIVAHADPYRTLYLERGEVIQDLGEEVIVAWDCWKERTKKTDRYSKDELRFWQAENN